MMYQCPICRKFLGKVTAYFNGLDEITRVSGICKAHGLQSVPQGHWDYTDFSERKALEKEDRMRVTICVNCKQSCIGASEGGRPICTTCFGGEFTDVEVNPEEVRCRYCGLCADERTGDLAFYDHKDKTYYCGCKGWE